MTDPDGSATVKFWVAVLGALLLFALALRAVGVPSSPLFAGVLAGTFGAIVLTPVHRPFPRAAHQVSLALVGVGAGSLLDRAVVLNVAEQPTMIVLGVVATLAITLLSGQVLRLSRHVDGPTASLASIAGGASGVSAVAAGMRADEGIVLSVQYVRVIVVVLTVPFVGAALAGTAEATAQSNPSPGWSDWVFTAAATATGLALARALRFTGASLFLSMICAGLLSLAQWLPSSTVPEVILAGTQCLIGLAVGLAITPATLRRISRLMPLVLVQLTISLVGCAAAGVFIARHMGMSDLDGYLATTPGGVPVVMAVAIGSGANVGLVVSMQVLRLIAALALAPLIAWLHRRSTGNC